jgi:hypothetical protein
MFRFKMAVVWKWDSASSSIDGGAIYATEPNVSTN